MDVSSLCQSGIPYAVFFFSSRRRHTRFDCDWSSDVCSSDLSLPNLLDDRSHLLEELSQLGDFQPGSITNATRRCGKPNCHCAKPSDPGHGPHRQLTQKIDGKTVTQTLSSPEAVRKAEKEIAEF